MIDREQLQAVRDAVFEVEQELAELRREDAKFLPSGDFDDPPTQNQKRRRELGAKLAKLRRRMVALGANRAVAATTIERAVGLMEEGRYQTAANILCKAAKIPKVTVDEPR